MCLVVLSLGEHPDYPLILAANRDEFYARPTRDANWWPDKPDVVGGRDLQAGGAWLAAQTDPRLTVLTSEANIGGAGGFERGMRHAVEAFDPDWIVVMDCDLQDQPEEIGRLLEPLEAGRADLVSGWKRRRRDERPNPFRRPV